MEKTIKEDRERQILKEELINENSLLECVYDKQKKLVKIGIRYIKSPIEGIRESILMTISMDDYISHFDSMIRLNESADTIATFRSTKEGYRLHSLYDITEHSYIAEDFIDITFKSKFPSERLNKNLVLSNNK